MSKIKNGLDQYRMSKCKALTGSAVKGITRMDIVHGSKFFNEKMCVLSSSGQHTVVGQNFRRKARKYFSGFARKKMGEKLFPI